MIPVKDGKEGFIQGEVIQWGFVVGERDWTQE